MSAKTQTVNALCQLLSRGDEADRCYVSRTLGVLQDSAALPALTEYLRDEDPDVCIDAAEALGRIGDPKAVPALLELLQNHPDGEVRTAAVEALGNISDPRVTSALITVAAKRPENLAWEDEWDDWWDMQLHAVKALGRMRAVAAVPMLQHILEDEESQGIETEILTALACIGGKGLKVLEQRLICGTDPERRRAATVLGHAGNDEAVALLSHALLDKNTDVRCAGIKALGTANATHYLKVVLVSLKDPEPEIRNAAIETSAQLASGANHADGIIEQLIPLLDDQNPLVRATTIKTLTTLATERTLAPGVVEQICLRLSDQDTAVVTAACHFLAQFRTPQAKSDLLQIATSQQAGIYLRQQAIHALGTSGDTGEEILNALTNAIGDSEQIIRLESLTTLMKLATSDAPEANAALGKVIDALRGQLEAETGTTENDSTENTITPDPENPQPQNKPAENIAVDTARQPATSTLEAISNSLETGVDTNSPLQTITPQDELDIPDEELAELQEYIELAEKNIQPSTGKKLDIADDVRLLSARVLATSNREEVITALVECLSCEEPELRREAAISIGRIAAHSADTPALQHTLGPLLTQLELGDEKMRHACTRTLAKLGQIEAFSHLLNALEDKANGVRIEAVNSLVELSAALAEEQHTETVSPAHILTRVLACLDDHANGVRLAAARGAATLLSQVDRKEFEKNVLENIIATACTNNGSQTREMGRILKNINIEASIDMLLQQLDTLQNSSERRFVIELLEEILVSENSSLYLV